MREFELNPGDVVFLTESENAAEMAHIMVVMAKDEDGYVLGDPRANNVHDTLEPAVLKEGQLYLQHTIYLVDAIAPGERKDLLEAA